MFWRAGPKETPSRAHAGVPLAESWMRFPRLAAFAALVFACLPLQQVHAWPCAQSEAAFKVSFKNTPLIFTGVAGETSRNQGTEFKITTIYKTPWKEMSASDIIIINPGTLNSNMPVLQKGSEYLVMAAKPRKVGANFIAYAGQCSVSTTMENDLKALGSPNRQFKDNFPLAFVGRGQKTQPSHKRQDDIFQFELIVLFGKTAQMNALLKTLPLQIRIPACNEKIRFNEEYLVYPTPLSRNTLPEYEDIKYGAACADVFQLNEREILDQLSRSK